MKNTDSKVDVLIAGAGITGLTLAWHLSRSGLSVQVIEPRNEPGGAMKSIQQGDWLAECGPGSILVSSEHINELFRDLGLENRVVRSLPQAKRRYLVKDSLPQPLPASLLQAVRTPLLSVGSKFKVIKEPFVKKMKSEDESVAEFVRRRLGSEFLDQFVNPLVGGIFAGDPERLSVRHAFPRLYALEEQHGSILKGQFKGLQKDPERKEIPRNKAEIISFDGGIQTLAQELAGKLSDQVSYQTRVKKVDQHNGGFAVEVTGQEGTKRITADNFVMTSPLHSLDQISFIDGETRWQDLMEMPYAPVSVINLGYRITDVGHPADGFGVLIPKTEPYRILGVQFNSSVFPGRAPEDGVMLTVFLGGMRYPNLVEKTEEEQLDIVESDLRRLLGITGKPQFKNIMVWPKAIPQYELGYDRYLKVFEELESAWPGLYLAGNFRGGISVGDCITNATLLARQIEAEANTGK